MDNDYIKYMLHKIDMAINEYTTMNREDVAEYVLTCLEILKSEYEKSKNE